MLLSQRFAGKTSFLQVHSLCSAANIAQATMHRERESTDRSTECLTASRERELID